MRGVLAVALLFVASCINPFDDQDSFLAGYWASPTAFAAAHVQGLSVQGPGWGSTDRSIHVGPGGAIAERAGYWSRSSPQGVLSGRVRFTGKFNAQSGQLLVVIADSASGERYFTQWLKPAPPPPPPASPPPPAP